LPIGFKVIAKTEPYTDEKSGEDKEEKPAGKEPDDERDDRAAYTESGQIPVYSGGFMVFIRGKHEI
jgi:hypothetical protein